MEKPFVLKNVSKLFRLAEICFALLLIRWFWSQIPFVATIEQLISVVKNPIFIFTLFNSILGALYIKSGKFTENSNSGDNFDPDLFSELTISDVFLTETDEIVYQDKEMIDVVSELEVDLVRERVEEEKSGEVAAAVEEELSSEEFKRTVENFIAKQMRFHFEEKMAIVAC